MALKYAGTLNAINRGLYDIKPAKGATMIEDWETALADVDVPGAKGIARDLAALRKQLEQEQPDGERIDTLLRRLGEATTKIAGRIEGAAAEKLANIGAALSESGGGDMEEDEEVDEEAAAAPRRRRS